MKSQEIDLGVYVRMIVRYWWLVGISVVVCTSLAAYYSYANYVPMYQASTKLVVNSAGSPDPLGQFDSIGSIGGLGVGGGGGGSIDLYREIIRTPIIMDKVVQMYPDLDVSAEYLMTAVSAYALNGTEVMVITATDFGHERAVLIANAVTKVFQTEIPKISGTGDVIILTEAKVRANPNPINEKQNTYIVVGFMASLIASAGIAILLDSFDTTLKRVEDIEKALDLPTLASIPELKPRRSSALGRAVGTKGDASRAAT